VIPVAEQFSKLDVQVEVPSAAGSVCLAAGGQDGRAGNLDEDEVGDAEALLCEQLPGFVEFGAPLAVAGMAGPPERPYVVELERVGVADHAA